MVDKCKELELRGHIALTDNFDHSLYVLHLKGPSYSLVAQLVAKARFQMLICHNDIRSLHHVYCRTRVAGTDCEGVHTIGLTRLTHRVGVFTLLGQPS